MSGSVQPAFTSLDFVGQQTPISRACRFLTEVDHCERLLLSAGTDCAGVMADSAPAATPRHQHDLCAGDAVFGLAKGSLGSHVVANTAALARMPPAADPEQASAAPTVFMTAEFALRDAVQTNRSARCA